MSGPDMSLGGALPAKMKYVREVVIPAYVEVGPAGRFALMMINAAMTSAEKAMASGDVVAMIAAYQELDDIKL